MAKRGGWHTNYNTGGRYYVQTEKDKREAAKRKKAREHEAWLQTPEGYAYAREQAMKPVRLTSWERELLKKQREAGIVPSVVIEWADPDRHEAYRKLRGFKEEG